MIDSLEVELYNKTSRYISKIEYNVSCLQNILKEQQRINDKQFDELFNKTFLLVNNKLKYLRFNLFDSKLITIKITDIYNEICDENSLTKDQLHTLLIRTFYNESGLEDYLEMSHEQIIEIYNKFKSTMIDLIKNNTICQYEMIELYKQTYKINYESIKYVSNIFKEYLNYIIIRINDNNEYKEKYNELLNKINRIIEFVNNNENDYNVINLQTFNFINSYVLIVREELYDPYNQICEYSLVNSIEDIQKTFKLSIEKIINKDFCMFSYERKYLIFNSFNDIERYIKYFENIKKLSQLSIIEAYKKEDEKACINELKKELENKKLNVFKNYDKNSLRLINKKLNTIISWFN